MGPLSDIVTRVIKYGVSKTRETSVELIFNPGGPAHIVMSVKTIRNYNLNYCDDIEVECLVPLGNYVKLIHGARENLTVTLFENRGPFNIVDTYNCIILNSDVNVNNNVYQKASIGELNTEAAYLKLQLIDKHIDELMTKTTRGIINNTNMWKTLTTIVGKAWFGITGGPYSKQISIIPPHNTKTYANVILPTDLPIIELPAFLQETKYGVYTGGIGIYSHPYWQVNSSSGDISILKIERMLWIYPLFAKKTDKRINHRLKVIMVDNDSLTHVERTYAIDPSRSMIILTSQADGVGERPAKRLREAGTINDYIESDSIMVRSHVYNSGDVRVSKVNYDDSYKRGTGANGLSKKVQHGIRSNKYDIETKTMYSSGTIVTVVWKFSFPQILSPSRIVEFYYEEQVGNKITAKKLDGVLQGVTTTIDTDSKMSVSTLHILIL